MKNTICQVDEDICTGCGACYNACPKGAISMQMNEEGFYYPVVDETACVDCGLCLKSCAAINPKYENTPEPECYAVWADDVVRMESASGGAFSLLADYILAQGGVVCGAAWDKDFNVEHIIIDKQKDLKRLKGVKYIQSSTQKTFSEIKRLLCDNIMVLFVGTPCQVAGLKAFLHKTYDNLYTVDLVCHGAPSPGLWQRYLAENGFYGSISDIKFRNKKYGWSQSLEIYLDKGIVYRGVPPIDVFYETFFILMNTRKSCGHCAFAQISRQGDLTIGDAWNCQVTMNDQKGTSEVLVNTDKGKNLFNRVRKNVKKIEKFDLEAAKKGNRALTRSFEQHPFRSRFFKLLSNHSIAEAYKYAVRGEYDVALLGIWFYQNYGCVLTTFALGRVLQKLGKEVLLVDNSAMFNREAPWRTGCIDIKGFLGRFFDIAECKTKEDLTGLNAKSDTFLVGSDQLFNWFLALECGGYTYFLDFAAPEKKKIAYATSFGDGYCFFKKEYFDCKPLLQRFDAISVRENSYLDIVNKEFDISATDTLDPVFLLENEEYEKLAGASLLDKDVGILAYILNMTQEKKEILEHLAKKLGKKVTFITDAAQGMYNQAKNFKIRGMHDNVSIYDWLHCFKYADYVFTDSFHGMCFSIIFKKDFVCLFNKGRGLSRFYPLLSKFGLEKRGFDEAADILSSDKIFSPVDYTFVYAVLNAEKRRSLTWLKQALDSHRCDDKKLCDKLLNKIALLEQEISQLQSRLKKIGSSFQE